MTTANVLPHINAVLNSIATVLLLIGFVLIKSGRKEAHRTIMTAAIVVSAVFLVSYLTYHFTAPIFVFPGTGWAVPAYYTLLVSHVVLATVVSPMVVVTAWRAFHGDFDRHKVIARWTWPVWMFVSVSGVAVYAILYHVYPAPVS
ncbi:MAG: DUF420 domain-containing protein [Rhodospirillaceae bacterium]|nr:DUF420 domain-containing protein [Rhodospirillaceae bacterium]